MSTLDPGVRLAFTDALRPPPGYVLSAGFGTAYSLDFDAFTAVVLAFVGADFEGDHPDAPSVLTAVARLKSRLRVFVNGGGLLRSKHPHRLFALYDRILRPIRLEGSAFHPKVWVLAFEPQDRPELHGQPRRYRLLCSSRNVTDSRCWELGARFEGEPGKGTALGSDLKAFGERLGKVHRHPPAILRLLAELRSVDWDSGAEAADALRLHFQWPGEGRLAVRLPARAQRALVLSPFLRDELLGELAHRVERLTLVSTQRELDALSEAAHARLAKVDKYVVTGAGGEDLPGLDLHAKLLAWENFGTTETLVGSANATGPGWGLHGRTNCEAMLALRPGLSIDAMLKAFVSPGRGEFHPWVEPYRPAPQVQDEADEAQRLLEGLQRELAGLVMVGTYDRSSQTLTLKAEGTLPETLSTHGKALRCRVAPLLRSDRAEAWQPLTSLFVGGASFPGVGIGELCSFAEVSLEVPLLDQSRIFGLQFDLRLSAEDEAARDGAVHAALPASFDPEALLLNILRGLPAGSGQVKPKVSTSVGQASQGTFLGRATIERVLEACTADRSRIDEVDALLMTCKDAPGMASFVDFWGELKAVLDEERGHG